MVISKLPPESQSEECPICFTPIDQTPGESPASANTVSEESANSKEQPLISQKLTTCFSTPCGHNFHQGCLIAWFDKKPDCPICRQALPYFE